MAQLALVGRTTPFQESRLYASTRNWTTRERSDRSGVRLYFPPETIGFRTPFRADVYRLIFEEADRIAHTDIDSFDISVWSNPGEVDSWTLVMTLCVTTGWDQVKVIRRALLDYLDELSREWSLEELEDYRKRLHFEVFPTHP